jgi:hypothetical protein
MRVVVIKVPGSALRIWSGGETKQGGVVKMLKVINRIIVLGIIVASIAVVGMSKELSKQVTFEEPVKVNGTLVKAGTYKVSFDETTSELTIFKGKKVLAKASAQLEKLDKRSGQAYWLWRNAGGEPQTLIALSLGDGNRAKLADTGDTKAE